MTGAARVYPRVCGGTRLTRSVADLGGRSIPACAGEPDMPPDESELGVVYPRVCGGTAVSA